MFSPQGALDFGVYSGPNEPMDPARFPDVERMMSPVSDDSVQEYTDMRSSETSPSDPQHTSPHHASPNMTSPENTSPASSSEGETKSKLGSKSGMPRTVFTRKQLTRLEERFIAQTFLSKEERQSLAAELKLTERQIMVWFQNRRGRLKRRGPADSAFCPEKIKELNAKRPYPFLTGMLTSSHFRYPHPHPYSGMMDPAGKLNAHSTPSFEVNGQNGDSQRFPAGSGFGTTARNGINSTQSMYYQQGTVSSSHATYNQNSITSSSMNCSPMYSPAMHHQYGVMPSSQHQGYGHTPYPSQVQPADHSKAVDLIKATHNGTNPVAPNATVSQQNGGKPMMMSSSSNRKYNQEVNTKNYFQVSNVNVHFEKNDIFANIGGTGFPMKQSGNSQNQDQVSNGSHSWYSAPPIMNGFSHPGQYSMNRQNHDGALSPAIGNSGCYEPRASTPVGESSPPMSYPSLPAHSGPLVHKGSNPNNSSTPQGNNTSTPYSSPPGNYTPAPCLYQGARPGSDRVVPSTVTVNFNNFGNSHIELDAPFDVPLQFDIPDITQNIQQKSCLNYA